MFFNEKRVKAITESAKTNKYFLKEKSYLIRELVLTYPLELSIYIDEQGYLCCELWTMDEDGAGNRNEYFVDLQKALDNCTDECLYYMQAMINYLLTERNKK